VIVDDLFVDWTPSLGEGYILMGVNDYTFGNFKIEPRDSSEIALISSPPGKEERLWLDHTPGDLTMSVANDGSIAKLSSGGNGITWKGYDGSYRAGILLGRESAGYANGKAHNNSPDFADMENIASDFASGFMSDANFNQVTEALISDSNATDPYYFPIIQKTMSNSGDNFVYYACGFVNNSGETIDDFWAGIFADHDIGGDNYESDRGGVSEGEHMVYQYHDETLPYYGIVALTDGDWGGVVDPSDAATVPELRQKAFTNISTVNAADPGSADQRSWIGSKFPSTAAGDTSWVYFLLLPLITCTILRKMQKLQ
jgi:hypothetical protein